MENSVYNPFIDENDDIEIRRLTLYNLKIKDFNGWFGEPAYKFSSEDLLDFYVHAVLRCHGETDKFGCDIIKHELLKRLH